MAKRLTPRRVETVAKVGFHGDGRGSYGLQLRVAKTTAGHRVKSWVQKIRINGKPTSLGLGKYPLVSLDEARLAALQNAIAVHKGIDPRTAAPAAPVAVPVAPVAVPSPGPTFREAVEGYIEIARRGWRGGGGSERKFRTTVEAVAFADKPVAAITREDVRAEIVPIWGSNHALASLRLSHIRRTLDFADVDPNPADGLAGKMPKTNGGERKHYEALPWQEVPDAMRKVRADADRPRTHTAGSLAVQLAILTASRPAEVTGARWTEIDGDTWTIPASRYKTGREHRAPLSPQALAVLDQARRRTRGRGLIFPSKAGGEMPKTTLRAVLQRQGIKGTLHGFRSSFGTWCQETGVSTQVREAALGHVVGGTPGAYARSDLLERRRPVIAAWGLYAAGRAS